MLGVFVELERSRQAGRDAQALDVLSEAVFNEVADDLPEDVEDLDDLLALVRAAL